MRGARPTELGVLAQLGTLLSGLEAAFGVGAADQAGHRMLQSLDIGVA